MGCWNARGSEGMWKNEMPANSLGLRPSKCLKHDAHEIDAQKKYQSGGVGARTQLLNVPFGPVVLLRV